MIDDDDDGSDDDDDDDHDDDDDDKGRMRMRMRMRMIDSDYQTVWICVQIVFVSIMNQEKDTIRTPKQTKPLKSWNL